jgi:adenine specific DNA methylase Mod
MLLHIMKCKYIHEIFCSISNQIKSIKKFYLKSVHFITVQHKLSRAFQTDIPPTWR